MAYVSLAHLAVRPNDRLLLYDTFCFAPFRSLFANFGHAAILGIARGVGGGVLPYMGFIGMCGPKGYGFSALLLINRVSI